MLMSFYVATVYSDVCLEMWFGKGASLIQSDRMAG